MPQTLCPCGQALASSSKISRSLTETGRKVRLGSGLGKRGQRGPGLGVPRVRGRKKK